jgi:hypothetical protein
VSRIGDARARASLGASRVLRRQDAAFYAVTLAVYLLLRAGSFNDIPSRLTDTASYERVAAASLWTLRFLAGERGLTVPLFYKIVPGEHARIVAQLLVSICCWVVLAAVVAGVLKHASVRRAGFVLVLGFSLTTPVILWDTLLLSESLSFSLLALLLAAWLSLVARPSWTKVGLVLLVSLLWTLARDTNAYVVLMTALFAAVSLLDRRCRRLKLGLAAGCVAVFGAGIASADEGKRWVLPMNDIVVYRVFPDPGLRRSFEEHGLGTTPGTRPDPLTEPVRSTYLRYLVSHPGYALGRPLSGRQEAPYSSRDNADSLLDPDLRLYNDNANKRFAPLPHELRNVLYPRGITPLLVVIGVVLAAAVALAARGFARTIWAVPGAALLTTYPHALVVWHFSGVEVDRHALTVALTLRLALLLLVVFVADAVLDARRRPKLSTAAPAEAAWPRA